MRATHEVDSVGPERRERQDLDEFVPTLYDELRRLAARHMRRERPGHTLQPTALVHEVYMRLAEQAPAPWQSRAHFFGIAAESMRRVLVEHARRRNTAKRGGGREAPGALQLPSAGRAVDVLALDDALTRLARIDPDRSRIVELRFFGGLTVEEAAEVLAVSPATVTRRWRLAKAWLYQRLKLELELPGAAD
jgi:RNA polymerase sigma factor (TIGR02999 family)